MSSSDLIFEALSSTVRRRILAYLSATPLTAGDIADRFEMSQPAISKHLSILVAAGLVWRKKEGQFTKYGMIHDTLAGTLAGFLHEVCPPSRQLKRESQKKSRQAKSNEQEKSDEQTKSDENESE